MGFTLSTLISWFKFDKPIVKPESFNPLFNECTEENNEVHQISKPYELLCSALYELQLSDLTLLDDDKFSPKLYRKWNHKFRSNKQVFDGLDKISKIFDNQLKDAHSVNYLEDRDIVLDQVNVITDSFGSFFVRDLSLDHDEYITFKAVVLGLILKLERVVSLYGEVNNHPIIDVTVKEYFDRKLEIFSEELSHYVSNLLEHGI